MRFLLRSANRPPSPQLRAALETNRTSQRKTRSQKQQESHDGDLPFFFSQRWDNKRGLKRSCGHHERQGNAGSPSRSEGLQNDRILQSLCTKGHLDRALDVLSRMHSSPSDNTYMYLLKACIKSKALTHANRVHAHIAHHRPHLTALLGGYLVVTLAKCGAIEDAVQISQTLPCRTVFSWTAIISAYVDLGSWQQALKIYQCMQEDGVEPDSHTFVSLFKACGSLPDLVQGKKLHTEARRKGLASVVFVANTLVSMYGKCGAVLEAEDVFSTLSEHTVVSWNAMLSAFVEQGQGEEALQLYRQMQEEDMSPNLLTFVIALQACGTLAEKAESSNLKGRRTKVMSLDIGHGIHMDAYRRGYTSDVLVGTTLVSMYGKCGTLSEAENVFIAMIQRNAVSWTAMLSAYVEQGQGERALWLYRQMQEEGMSPNQLTFLIALQACGIFAEKEAAHAVNGQSIKAMSLEIGRALHADACRMDYASDASVCSTLLNVYGKCGALVEAEGVFNVLSQRNVVLWTAMLSAYVEQGQGKKALWLYRQMQEEHVTLDAIILMCILQACSETGSLGICKKLHFEVVSAGHEWMSSVAATLIHAYGCCASMIDAQAVFDGLHEPSMVSWNACVSGHAGEGHSVASLHMFEKLKLAGLEPDGVTFTAVLSACSYIGIVVKGLDFFESMIRDHGITPDLKHYGSMVDLLGRAGDFKRVGDMLGGMPMQADLTIWLCLLGACRIHGNLKHAEQAFNHAVHLQPKQAAAYVLMSNIYANAGLHECAAQVENSRLREGAWEPWPELD